jgi:hypothetical protein
MQNANAFTHIYSTVPGSVLVVVVPFILYVSYKLLLSTSRHVEVVDEFPRIPTVVVGTRSRICLCLWEK